MLNIVNLNNHFAKQLSLINALCHAQVRVFVKLILIDIKILGLNTKLVRGKKLIIRIVIEQNDS